MSKEEINRIQQIMSQTNCDNDFHCYKTGFKNLCKVKVVGDGQLVDCSKCEPGSCLRHDNRKCSHRIPFGFGHFCTCPLRIYAAQNPNVRL